MDLKNQVGRVCALELSRGFACQKPTFGMSKEIEVDSSEHRKTLHAYTFSHDRKGWDAAIMHGGGLGTSALCHCIKH